MDRNLAPGPTRQGRPATALATVLAARRPRREMLIMALIYQSQFVLHTMEYRGALTPLLDG